VETESYITPWNQRDHSWSLDQFDAESADDFVAETKLLAPGIDFAQRGSINNANEIERLGMRSVLLQGDEDIEKEEKEEAD